MIPENYKNLRSGAVTLMSEVLPPTWRTWVNSNGLKVGDRDGPGYPRYTLVDAVKLRAVSVLTDDFFRLPTQLAIDLVNDADPVIWLQVNNFFEEGWRHYRDYAFGRKLLCFNVVSRDGESIRDGEMLIHVTYRGGGGNKLTHGYHGSAADNVLRTEYYLDLTSLTQHCLEAYLDNEVAA